MEVEWSHEEVTMAKNSSPAGPSWGWRPIETNETHLRGVTVDISYLDIGENTPVGAGACDSPSAEPKAEKDDALP